MTPFPLTVLAALTTWVSGWAFTAPYRKTALARDGSIAAGQPVVVALSATEHRPGQRREFFKDTRSVLAELPQHPGLIGYAFRFEIFGNAAWTMTAWRDDAALGAFVRSPTHREAIRRSGQTAQNLRFATVELPASALPLSWREARRLLEAAPGYRASSERK